MSGEDRAATPPHGRRHYFERARETMLLNQRASGSIPYVVRRPLLRSLAVGALLAVAACGDDPVTTPRPPEPTVPTTITTSSTAPATVNAEETYSAPDPSVCPIDRSGDIQPPQVVGGVQGGASAGSEETLFTWRPSTAPDVVCYRVERRVSPNGKFVTAAIVRVEGTEIVPHPEAATRNDPNLSFDGERFELVEYGLAVPGGRPGCCFYYRVIAIDGAGNSSRPSAISCAATLVAEQSDDNCESQTSM